MFHLRSATVDVNILRLASSGKFAVLVRMVPENSGQRKAAKLPKEAEIKAESEVGGISEVCLFLHSKAPGKVNVENQTYCPQASKHTPQ